MVMANITDFGSNDLVSILFSATKPGLKKREVKRQAFQLSLESMKIIAFVIKSSKGLQTTGLEAKEIENLKQNYFEIIKISQKFILNDEMKK